MIVDHRSAFLADVRDCWALVDIDLELGRMRAEAWRRFEELGLPDRHTEAYKYFPVHMLYREHFGEDKEAQVTASELQRLVMPECEQSYIVFVNGEINLELSCLEGVEGSCIVRNFEDAMRSYAPFLKGHFGAQIKKEEDALAQLHNALYQGGIFIYLPAKSKLDVPIQILNISTNRMEPIMTLPKVQIFAAKETSAEVIVTHHALGEESLLTHLYVDSVLEEEAHLKCTQVLSDSHISWGFLTLRANLKSKAHLEHVHIAYGPNCCRFDYSVNLMGEKASVNLSGAGLAQRSQSIHAHVNIQHLAPSTYSSQLFKGALREEGIGAFAGKIFVDPIAQQTDAFQLCRHLLLDLSAKAYAKPGLEIYADDVKASHGATAGPLEAAPHFYLRARGIDEKQIEHFLVRAHFKEVAAFIRHKGVQGLFSKALESFCV